MIDENEGLSNIEQSIRDKLKKVGILGPNSETSKPTVRRPGTAPSLTASVEVPEDIVKLENLNVEPETSTLSNAVLATKPILQGKVKEIDGRFLSLEDLPSNFYPYERKQLLIRPFAVTELKLIARAIETGDSDYITQAIDNCIDFPVTELTIVDYFYLYYWMRIQSYPNTPHYMEWKCDEVSSADDDEDDESVCGHENMTALTSKELKVIYLNDLQFDAKNLDPRLDFPRVSLLQDLSLAQESKTAIRSGKNKEATFSLDDLVLVNAAKWIKEGTTLREKIEILEKEPDLELYEIASKTNKAFEYGVYEYAMVKCGRCGAKRRYRVLLDAPRFFPFAD